MNTLTRSPIENIFTKISEKISPTIYNLSITNTPPQPNNITTIGLISNLFSIMALREGQILVCIIFAIIGQYLDNLDGFYAKKYNMETKIGQYYDHLADNIKILGLIFVFYILYEDKIQSYHISIFICLAIIGNINFALRIRLKHFENESYDIMLEPWNILGKIFGSKENVIKLSKFTRYFDDTSLFIYYLFAIIYFHYFIDL